MNILSPFDWAIIIGFILFITGAGLLMSKRAASGWDDYLLGGRKLPWYLLGMSGMSKWFDVAGTMIITSFLFMLGPQGLFVEFRGGAVLVLAFLLVVAGKWNRRSGCRTEADWQIFRYGTGKDADAARFLAAIVGILAVIGGLGYLVKGAQLFLGMFLPFSPTVAALSLVGITTLYTMFAGFYGVVITDLIQGLVILLCSVIIGIIAWSAIGSVESLGATATAVTGNAGWLDYAPAWNVDMPEAYGAYEGLILVMLFYLIRNTFSGVGGGSEPRFFGAKSDRECGLQCLLQGAVVMFRWPMMIGIAVLGIFFVSREMPDAAIPQEVAQILKEQHPTIRESQWVGMVSGYANRPEAVDAALQADLSRVLGEDWPEKLRLVGYHGTVNPELILPAVIKTELPVGLRGLLLVAMLAALMSTFDSALNVASGLFVNDIYRRWLRPKASEKECVRASYVTVPLLVVLGVWLGLGAHSINDIWGWLVMGLGTGSAAPAILRMIWWRMNGWGVAASLFCGTIAAILQRALIPELNEWFQFLLMGTVSFSAAIGVSLLTRRTDDATVLNFYRKTKPFGWWKPIRSQLPESEQQAILRENRTDMIAIPFVLLAQVTLFLIAMLVVIHDYAGMLTVLPLFLIGAAGMWWFWWRPLDGMEGGGRHNTIQSSK